jgi:hypothetical protein
MNVQQSNPAKQLERLIRKYRDARHILRSCRAMKLTDANILHLRQCAKAYTWWLPRSRDIGDQLKLLPVALRRGILTVDMLRPPPRTGKRDTSLSDVLQARNGDRLATKTVHIILSSPAGRRALHIGTINLDRAQDGLLVAQDGQSFQNETVQLIVSKGGRRLVRDGLITMRTADNGYVTTADGNWLDNDILRSLCTYDGDQALHQGIIQMATSCSGLLTVDTQLGQRLIDGPLLAALISADVRQAVSDGVLDKKDIVWYDPDMLRMITSKPGRRALRKGKIVLFSKGYIRALDAGVYVDIGIAELEDILT